MYQQGFGDYTNIVGTENGTGKTELLTCFDYWKFKDMNPIMPNWLRFWWMVPIRLDAQGYISIQEKNYYGLVQNQDI